MEPATRAMVTTRCRCPKVFTQIVRKSLRLLSESLYASRAIWSRVNVSGGSESARLSELRVGDAAIHQPASRTICST